MCSGTSPDDRLVEVIELPDHPYFVASQYHPEFKSRPNRPEPLFREFVGAALARARERGTAAASRPVDGSCAVGRAGAEAMPPDARRTIRAARQLVTRGQALAATPARARLGDTFVAPLRDPEPERAARPRWRAPCAAELEALGLDVTEDDTAAETGAGCGNLLARIPGPARRAHRDARARTSTPCRSPTASRSSWSTAVYRNRRDAILGADDKAGVAVLLEVARGAGAARARPCGCELVFTTSEEVGLRGARAFDASALAAEFGFVLDHAAPIGAHGRGRADLLRACTPSSWAAPHTRASGPRTGAARSSAAAKAIESMRLGRHRRGDDGERRA